MKEKVLNRYERKLKNIKRHKKKTFKHTLIAFIVSFILIVGYNQIDTYAVTNTKVPNGTEKLNITLVGDIMTGRYVEEVSDRFGDAYLYRHVVPYFKTADFLTGNFENPVVLGNYPASEKNISYKTDAKAATELKNQGFDVVNMSNDHMMDYKERGLMDTLNTFKRVGVQTVGAGKNVTEAKKIAYKVVNGYTIATVGYTDTYRKESKAAKNRAGILEANPEYYMQIVRKAKQNADIVIVHAHWGQAYDGQPQPRQKGIGHALVDAGADIVVGHGPHVLQPIEFYKKGVVMYSLGNFVFDQGWSRTRESAIVQYKIAQDGTAKLEVHPMYIRGSQPRPLSGVEDVYSKYRVYSHLTNGVVKSAEWKKTWKIEGDKITHRIGR